MIPIITPTKMAELDAAAAPLMQRLIDRAGRATAKSVLAMLGGSYGRRVLIVAGPGNNGSDGRRAAHHLSRRGVRVEIIGPSDRIRTNPDLVVDAAFGTGLRRPYRFPSVDAATPVLAVDIPSGVDGLTGELHGKPTKATRTITFAALKPGLVLEPGRSFCGEVKVAEIGLGIGAPNCGVVEACDVASVLPQRLADSHKWLSAIRIVGGSTSMQGAATLAASAAQRAGAGLVQLAMPGSTGGGPVETVGHALGVSGWGAEAIADTARLQVMLIGSGLGRDDLESTKLALTVELPLVVDGDALLPETLVSLKSRTAATVLTPHEGEWRRLGGSTSVDRIAATKEFAQQTGAVIVRKGPTTVVADPGGDVRVIADGSPVLATAGTGDVLAGIIAGLMAQNTPAFDAAWAGVWLHAAAGNLAGLGAVAGDLPDLLQAVLVALRDHETVP